jgi:coenzyme F420-dependent glucose-6-phosphate dehydrogenase
VIAAFDSSGGAGKPGYGGITCCWVRARGRAKTAREIWPNAALGGDLGYELPRQEHFEQATADLTPEALETIPCGPDPDLYLEDIRGYERPATRTSTSTRSATTKTGSSASWRKELQPKL